MGSFNLINRLRFLFNYDPETGVITWANPTARNVKKGQIAGSNDRHGYRKVAVDRKTMLVHRVAWAIVYGEMPDGFLDHINGDRMDNRISNLRVCTSAQNSANSNKPIGLLQLRGVTMLRSKKYQASIAGKYLGTFETTEEAREVYELASVMLYGDFSPYARKNQEAVNP